MDRFFNRQQLEKFFQILHGPTYTDLVRQFWVKTEIYDKEASDRELAMKIKEDKSGKKKTRADFGLPKFEETEIRSNVMGLDVKISQSLISRVIGAPNVGLLLKGTSEAFEWASQIKETTRCFTRSSSLVCCLGKAVLIRCPGITSMLCTFSTKT